MNLTFESILLFAPIAITMMSTAAGSSPVSSDSYDSASSSNSDGGGGGGTGSDSSEQTRGVSNKTLAKTNHLVLMVGHSVLQAFSTSTFAMTYLREHELNPVPHRVIDCASSTATHSCQKRSFAKNFEACQLFEEMPSVTKLEVVCAPAELNDERIESSVVNSIAGLLAHWAKSLNTLKLLFQYEPSSYGTLLDAINGLTELRHLTLEIDQLAAESGGETEDDNTGPNVKSSNSSDVANKKSSPSTASESSLTSKLDLPVLAKLEEFFYRAPNITPQLVDTLKKYGEAACSPLKRIGLGNERGFKGVDLEKMTGKLNSGLAERFVSVPSIQRPFTTEQLSAFLAAYKGITSLTIDAAQLSLVSLSAALAPLHSLLYLRLTNAFFNLGHALAADDAVPASQVNSLPSVRSLTLEIFAKSHTFLQSAHWGQVFPGLTEAKVTNHRTNCAICEGQSRCSFTKPPPEARINCTRLLMEPLKQCSQLLCTYPVNIVGPEQATTTSDHHTADTAGASKCCKH